MKAPAANEMKGAGPIRRDRLFAVGTLALFTAAFSFVLRAGIASQIQADVIAPFDPVNAGQLIGAALGVAFLGFALSLFVTSPLLDFIGMGRMLVMAAVFFFIGPALVVFADTLFDGRMAYRVIYLGMLINGMGWGFTEATINPMTAALYPEDKVHRMNVIHAWWPAGIIAGGLVAYALGSSAAGIDWRILFGLVMLPPIAIVALVRGQTFPKTESAAMGVPFSDMLMEVFRKPLFFVWLFAMILTSATELAPGQWVDVALSEVVGMRGILLLVYVAGIMFVMRHFAGPIAHRISDVGLLCVSCGAAAVGLYLLSVAGSPLTAVLAATLWGAGVCFLWPTMLSAVAGRFPRGGAWTIGLIGSAGAGTIYWILPKLGAIYDNAKIAAAGGEGAFATLTDGPARDAVLAEAARVSFQTVAWFPVILIAVFGVYWVLERRGRQSSKAVPAE
ncbi:MAG: MFS transporter [Pseudomonadota bacterium]